MKAGIIAAGLGTRLAQSHPGVVKPLVPVAGTPLCHWVAGSLLQGGFSEITLVHNSAGRAIRESLTRAFPAATWSFLERDTASSWETFRILSRALAAEGAPFLISTVDAIVPPAELAAFALKARETRADAALALTDFIDDEKPLYADVDPQGLVSALGPDAKVKRLATVGLYLLTPAAVEKMPDAARFDSLRGYLTELVRGGARVAGVTLKKTIDVDRPEDLRAAEGFLKEVAASW
jgi:NDP-sugar pyrophosphorylase family protein